MGHLSSGVGTVQAFTCSVALGIWHSSHTYQGHLARSAAAGGESKALTAFHVLMTLPQHQQPQFASSSPALQGQPHHEWGILSDSSFRVFHNVLTPSQKTFLSSLPPPYVDAIASGEVGWVSVLSSQPSLHPVFTHKFKRKRKIKKKNGP